MPVEGEKAAGRVLHLGIDTDAAVTVIENEAVHLLTVILPHDPSVREQPLEELWESAPESIGFPDCKMTMSAITSGIDYDPIVNVTEISREAALKIDAVMTSLAFNHFHMLYLFFIEFDEAVVINRHHSAPVPPVLRVVGMLAFTDT